MRSHNVQGGCAKSQACFGRTRYSAHDPPPGLVHATLVDMNLRVYELFVDCPSVRKDRYCAEASAIEERLGIRRTVPRTFGALRQYMDTMLAAAKSRSQRRA